MLCFDYDGALEMVSVWVDVLWTWVKKWGVVIDTWCGLVVEFDSEVGGCVCVLLLGEVDGVFCFGIKLMGQ